MAYYIGEETMPMETPVLNHYEHSIYSSFAIVIPFLVILTIVIQRVRK